MRGERGAMLPVAPQSGAEAFGETAWHESPEALGGSQVGSSEPNAALGPVDPRAIGVFSAAISPSRATLASLATGQSAAVAIIGGDAASGTAVGSQGTRLLVLEALGGRAPAAVSQIPHRLLHAVKWRGGVDLAALVWLLAEFSLP